MKFVIIMHDKTKIPITREERDEMLANSVSGSAAFLLKRIGAVISLRPFPNILPAGLYKPTSSQHSKDGVLISHGQPLPTAEELGFIPTEETERKRIAWEATRTKYLAGHTIPRLTEMEQREASAEERQRANPNNTPKNIP